MRHPTWWTMSTKAGKSKSYNMSTDEHALMRLPGQQGLFRTLFSVCNENKSCQNINYWFNLKRSA